MFFSNPFLHDTALGSGKRNYSAKEEMGECETILFTNCPSDREDRGEGRRRQPTRLAGGSSNEQGNFLRGLSAVTTRQTPHPPARILKVYTASLRVFSHDGLNNTLPSQG